MRRVGAWDAIVSHWLVPAALVASWLPPRPQLAIAHGSDARLLAWLPLGGALARRIAGRADLVYVTSSIALAGAPGRVVPMAVEMPGAPCEPREACRRALRLDRFTLLFLGRLVADKGADRAIHALPAEAELLIAGAGPEEATLRRIARGRSVRLLGEVRGADKRRLFAAADALVVPSRSDGAPTVVREAQAAGLPVIATAVGGLPELIDDGATGLLCAPTDDGLAAAVRRLVADPTLRDRLARGGRAVSRTHGWDMVGPLLWGQRLPAIGRADRPGTLAVCRV
jgi:2-deoxystreptamine N-acetyl-D-glucosaminyltransferase/2-deoxystreptamine glucosyltransferase